MPKTIIIDKSVIDSGVLNEAIEINQLPSFLRVENPFTGNRCLPSDGFIEHEMLEAFKSITTSEVVRNGYATENSISETEKQCQEIENPMRNNLEQLITQTVTNFFGIPGDKIDFSVELVDSIDQSNTKVPFGPDENTPMTFDSIDTYGVLNDEVSKRVMQNALIAGASLAYARLLLSDVVGMLDEINPKLFDLYNDYFDINNYLLYTNDSQITEENKQETGEVIVTLGNDERKNQLEAKGTIFPVLLYETIKGFFEIFTSHGLPEDEALATAVMSKSDYLLAEPWYMRLGPQIWGHFSSALRDIGYYKRPELLPYVLMKLSQLSAQKYNRLIQEILTDTERSRKVLNRVCEYAEAKHEKQGFNDRLMTNRSRMAFMIDDEKEI